MAKKFWKSENIAEGGERNAGVRGRELCNTKEPRVQETQAPSTNMSTTVSNVNGIMSRGNGIDDTGDKLRNDDKAVIKD